MHAVLRTNWLVGAALVLSSGLASACAYADLTAPEPVTAVAVVRTKDVIPPGPSHEIRLFVAPDGTPTGMEAVRLKSFRKNFVAKSDKDAGKRLTQVPEKAAAVAAKLSQRPELVSLAIYEQPRGQRRPVERMTPASLKVPSPPSVATKTTFLTLASLRPTDDPNELPWYENPEAFSSGDHESYIDSAINEMISLGDSYLAQYPVPEPDPEESLPTAGASIMFNTGANVGTPVVGPIVGTDPVTLALAMSGPCSTKKLAVGIAAVAVVGAVAAGTVAMVGAGAPIAFAMGGITGMALPAASSVIATHVGAIAGIASAGAGLGWMFSDLMDCLGH